MSSRIEDYALIGDCRSAALVAIDGSIDWLCWPRFDSGACLAALLGTRENGRWLIAPQDKTARVSRQYRAKTLILETRFETDGGVVTLIDFMPPLSGNPTVVRLVVGERGSVTLRLELVLRFSYGVIVPWVSRLEDGTLRAIAGPDMVLLRTPVHTKGDKLTTVGVFTVRAGEMVPFLLTYVPSHVPLPPAVAAQEELEATEKFWQSWVSACRPTGPWSEVVQRSLITLKALTYAPTGGIVAAPTTSLPEQLGGERNWDYRFCWLRDATMTLLTLMNAGFHDGAQAWNEWLLRAIAGSPEQIQVMYGLAGERRIIEWRASWLSGYERSRPVRIGNAAYRQRQLDVYGEVLDASHHVYGEVVDASHQARRSGLAMHASGWAVQLAMLDHLAQIWQEPDRGIWEVRGSPQRFTHSGVMAWVAFDRAIKSAEMFDLDGPIDRWRQVRADIHADVCAHGFNAEIGSFVQCYGSTRLDASLLLIPVVGFLPINDERVRGTIAAIERHLMVDGLVVRYNTESHVDGLPPGEGVFLACSFWLADVYVMQNREADAINLFNRLVSLCNDVGLLSEEYDPRSGRLVGNFPQAFSHLALVNTAFNLTLATKPIEQRAHPEAEKLALVR